MSKIKKDWRLPTIQELLTLVDYTKHTPACTIKDTVSCYYWSSSSNVSLSSRAWYVDFKYGYSNYYGKTDKGYVRCVRTSKKGKLQWSKSSKKEMTWSEAFKYAENLKTEVYYKG